MDVSDRIQYIREQLRSSAADDFYSLRHAVLEVHKFLNSHHNLAAYQEGWLHQLLALEFEINKRIQSSLISSAHSIELRFV